MTLDELRERYPVGETRPHKVADNDDLDNINDRRAIDALLGPLTNKPVTFIKCIKCGGNLLDCDCFSGKGMF